MALQSGDRLGPYEVIGGLGAGGMGEVYRARDTRLNRDVALKVLPESFAADPDRLMRFEREAQALASLNHPNIAGIYGIEEADGGRAIVMELVEGEDLSEIIAAGSEDPARPPEGAPGLQTRGIPLEAALSIARSIADALEAAHDAGIIHRDLKPANVKVKPDGTVKVLDFGLAKALDPETSDPRTPGPSDRALTMTSPAMTQMGMILGTAAYMSPEQARGKVVDKRADVWAFGCVLYEMLTGKRPFEDEDVSLTLSRVLQSDPDFDLLPASVPPRVRQVVRLCLRKSLRERIPDIGAARLALEGAFETAGPTAATPAPAVRRVFAGAIAAAAIALLAGVALGRYALAPTMPATQTFEFEVSVPGWRIEMGSFALSPDGSRLALVIWDEAGDRQLALRDMNLTEARVLPGTTGAVYPFWSPDGREIAYFAGNQLYRLALDGAAARPVAPVTDPRGGAWATGDILLIGSGAGPIYRIPASGGRQPEPLTELEAGVENAHSWPAMLPDGKRFVFMADAASDEGHRIRLGSLDGGPTTILRSVVRSQAVVDPAGFLLIGERGQLLAYDFDLESGSLSDESTLVATQVDPIGNQHQLPASVSVRGMLAYQNTSAASGLVFVDDAGRTTRAVGLPDRYGNVSVSPDQKRLAFEIFTDTTERLVWVEDLERGVRTAISPRGAQSDSSAWSPDGTTVYFNSDASGTWQSYRKTIIGGGDPESLGAPEGTIEGVQDVSPDGRWLLVASGTSGGRNDLFLRSIDGSGDAWTGWATGPANEASGTFSPDSRWIAYSSDASGRAEVYVSPLEGGPSAERWQISSGGGVEPRFSPDGRTIYYRSPTFDWMAVDVRMTGQAVEAGAPRVLFPMPVIELPYLRNVMDVLPDGSGFVTVHPASSDVLSIRVRTGR